MRAVISFLKKEPVLIAAFLAMLISCFFVPPDPGYAEYPDFRTLATLYALMTVVAGLREAGLFSLFSRALSKRAKTVRSLSVLLITATFFSAMFITNDVAILTFIPFTAAVLGRAGRGKAFLIAAVLETVAANLGSAATPVGNPQNLFLFSHYEMTLPAFLETTLPIAGASLLLLLLAALFLPAEKLAPAEEEETPFRANGAALYAALLIVCLLSVMRLLPWYWMLGTVIAVLLIVDRKALLRADFSLLLTFLAFFVFSGNLSRIDAVDAFLRKALEGRVYLTSLLTSQVISNVPSALLLADFTEDARSLLWGVNVGGLGTPVASLASLIGLRLYARSEGAKTGKFLLVFTAVNLVFLLLLSGLAALILR